MEAGMDKTNGAAALAGGASAAGDAGMDTAGNVDASNAGAANTGGEGSEGAGNLESGGAGGGSENAGADTGDTDGMDTGGAGVPETPPDGYDGLINARRLELFGRECIAPIVGAMVSLAESSNKMAEKIKELEEGNGGASVFRIPAVAVGVYAYNGQEQGPTIAGLDERGMAVAGATAVNAGGYTLTISLKDKEKQVWSDLTTEDKTWRWEIAPKIVEAPVLSGTAKTYNGAAQSPEIPEVSPDEVQVSGTTSAADAGAYTVTFALTNTTNYIWSDNTNAPKSGAWTIAKKALAKPALSGAGKVYNGSAQSPGLPSVNAAEIVIGGTTRATDAGAYTVTYTLANTNNYIWTDNTTAPKSDAWTISQAAASLSVSRASVSLDNVSLSTTVTVSKTGDGAISARSSDESVARASLSGGALTITSPNRKNGSATVTVSLSGTKNYAAPADKPISVSAGFAKIYGAEWDGTSSSKWARTDSAAGFTDPSPAVNNGAGSSPFDGIQPWAGMVREERAGGSMVKIPKYYYKWTKNGARMKLQISASAFAGSHVSPAHADRGDGKGERSVAYVGRYHCADDFKSRTGEQPKTYMTRAQFREKIHELGQNVWQYDFAMYWTVMMLYLVEFADWNSQKTIGFGCGTKAYNFDNAGATDRMGYHTGTNANARTDRGVVQYRYIEGLWDNVYDFCDGIYFANKSVYCIKSPSKFSDSGGGTRVYSVNGLLGTIKAYSIPAANGFEYALYPSEAINSGSARETYACDEIIEHINLGTVLRIGGSCNDSDRHVGAFHFMSGGEASLCMTEIGSRIQELP